MQVSNEQGEELVRHARLCVSKFLSDSDIRHDEFKERFSFSSGVFVTLSKNNRLRGCIGYPIAQKMLSEALIESAIAAATDDPRFPAVSIDELDEITFEVTVLSSPKTIRVDDPLQYPDRIKVGQDGLIIKQGHHAGLLLPQVPVEYGWNEVEFLENTCQKAELEKDCWKNSDTIIQKFQGVIFAETSPNGDITRL